MSFGLTNAPAAFQQLMEKMHGRHVAEIMMIFQYFQKHDQNKVLANCYQTTLSLIPQNVIFFRPSVTYLGHVVAEHRISANPEK